jgi:hypothetical protein
MRQCGDCQLCCKLLPVRELDKAAGVRCEYQKFGKGCTVYRTRAMPACCGLWNCRWLVNDDCGELPRPDRAHYVLDIIPDYVTWVGEDGTRKHIQTAQVWCDPKYPDAWETDALLNWIERRAQDGIATTIRFNATDGIVVFAPPISSDGEWHKIHPRMHEKSHTLDDIANTLGPVTLTLGKRT